MRCHEVKTVLALDDCDARIDRDALRSHLGSCARCTDRWPEVGLLLGAASPATRPAAAGRSRRRAGKAVAAGLVAVAAVGIALRPAGSGPGGDQQSGVDPERPAPIARSEVRSSSMHETITFDRGQRYESRVTYEVWTAPTPSCLTGGSGS